MRGSITLGQAVDDLRGVQRAGVVAAAEPAHVVAVDERLHVDAQQRLDLLLLLVGELALSWGRTA